MKSTSVFNYLFRGRGVPDMKRRFFGVFVVLVLSMCLAPQAMAVGTPAGTSIENQAYADYQDANGNPLPRVYSNTVTTVVSQVGGVDVTPATAIVTGAQGTSATIGATISNTGNGSDTFDLVATNPCGWTVTIYWDENGNDVKDPAETTVVSDTGALAADGEFELVLVVEIPAGTANGTTCDTTLTATSQFDGGISDSGTYTTLVEDAVLTVTKSVVDTTSYKPGDTITFALEGHNSGTATAESVVLTDAIPASTTYVPDSIKIGPVGGTYAAATALSDESDGDAADYNITNPGKITVTWGDSAPEPDPTGSGVIYFRVTVDSGITAGTRVENVADVNYSIAGNPQPPFQSGRAFFDVENLPSVLLDPDRAGTGNPGDQVVYAFTATNAGNASDTIDLTYTSNAGWTWVIWKDVDGNGIPGTDGDFVLTDTDADTNVDTGPLAEGAGVALLAVATIPAGVADGTVDTTVITGASSIDTAVTDPENLTTTVTAPVLSVAKTVSPTGNQPPGTELLYTVTVTNTGTGVSTAVVITDIIPTYTTYKAGSIKTGAAVATVVSRSDANDGDGGTFDSGSNAVLVPDGGSLSLGPGGSTVVQFSVTID